MKVFIFAVFFVSMVFAQSNWCSISSCSSSKPHIACNHTGAFNKSCISPCAIIFTTSQVKLIVDGHNSYRDLIASGKMLPKFSAATRMAKMAWDPQLAQFADLNTKQCMMVSINQKLKQLNQPLLCRNMTCVVTLVRLSKN